MTTYAKDLQIGQQYTIAPYGTTVYEVLDIHTEQGKTGIAYRVVGVRHPAAYYVCAPLASVQIVR